MEIVDSNTDPEDLLILKDTSIPVESQGIAAAPKKSREVDDTLIQYKESAFLSDMLSSSKD